MLPEEYKDEMRAAAKKVNLDFDKDFKLTDNTCKPHTADTSKVKRVRTIPRLRTLPHISIIVLSFICSAFHAIIGSCNLAFYLHRCLHNC